MTELTNPLTRLVLDEAAVDLELLASTLEAKVRLDVRQGGVSFLQGVRSTLSNRQQILTLLLAQLALHILEPQHPAGLRPQEIEARTGIKGGTLRPILKTLTDDRVIRSDASKAYYVPGYAIEDAARLLLDGRNSP
jgi:hypothetical protein